MSWSVLFLYWYGDHRELHVRTHSFPTRLSSELKSPTSTACIFISNGGCSHKPEAARLADALLDRLGLLNERPKPRELYELTVRGCAGGRLPVLRSEEHTSELQSLMRISYAAFCLNKTTTPLHPHPLCNTM